MVAIPRIFGIQNILPLSSPFSLAIDVIGRGALWVELPRQPTGLSWVLEGRRLGLAPGFCSYTLRLVWGSASYFVLGANPACPESSLSDIGTCVVKYKNLVLVFVF
jgi:hypothetical protein